MAKPKEDSLEFDLKQKVYLVTGGAAGIGAGIVRALLFNNAWHVAFLDILEREGGALEAELTTKFGALRAKFIKCDISIEENLSEAYKQVINKYHRLDGVVNNAALLSADRTLFKRIIDVNFSATVNSTMIALDLMKQNESSVGVIVNTSSLLALRSAPHLPVYAATKAAVLQFTHCIAAEQNESDIRIVTVCLGPTDTAILERQNSINFDKDSAPMLSSRVGVRQRVESAVSGIIQVIKHGENGSTWVIADDQAAVNVTENVKTGFDYLSKGIGDEL